MKLTLSHTKVYLANVNARAELHGEERASAGDLKLEVDLPNDVLSELHPALKGMFYCFDTARAADLVDAAKKDEPGFMPHLRLPQLGGPQKWGEEMTGMKFTLHGANGKSELSLLDCKVNNLTFEPKDGGTVSLTLRVQAHPDERAFGKLCAITQSEVEVSLAPGE